MGSEAQNFSDDYSELTGAVLKAAFAVHSFCGPGLLESAYQECLIDELQEAGLKVEAEVPMPMNYRGRVLVKAYVIDLLVEKKLIVELKSVEKIIPLHKNQVKTYLKFSRLPVGLLINFNAEHLRDGIQRVTIR